MLKECVPATCGERSIQRAIPKEILGDYGEGVHHRLLFSSAHLRNAVCIGLIQYVNEPKVAAIVRDIHKMAITCLSAATSENLVPALTRVGIVERDDMNVSQPVLLSVY